VVEPVRGCWLLLTRMVPHSSGARSISLSLSLSTSRLSPYQLGLDASAPGRPPARCSGGDRQPTDVPCPSKYPSVLASWGADSAVPTRRAFLPQMNQPQIHGVLRSFCSCSWGPGRPSVRPLPIAS
jgi:hypothetical protein